MPHAAKYTAISAFGVFLSIFGAITSVLAQHLKKYIKWYIAALLFAATYALYTDGIVMQANRMIIGRLDMQSDVPVFYNNIYLFEKKVQAGENPLNNDMEMYPAGFNMAMNSHNFAMGIFCLPFKNNMQGLNMGLWLSFILSGLGAAFLCYRFVPNYWAAVLVGFIFAFSPWKMLKLQDHHWFALTATIPFYIYHFIDIFDFKRRRYLPSISSYKKIIYCFLLGAVTALSEYYLTFFLIYFSLFYVLIKQYVQPWRINFKKPKTWGIIAFAVVGISILVSVLDGAGWDNKGAFFWGGDLAAYFLPVYQTWVKDFIGVFGFEIPAYQENFFFLGFSFIAFTVLVFIKAKKSKITPPEDIKAFAWLALLFVLFSLPVLKVLGHFLFYLPTAIFHYIPFFNNVRVITRIFILFSLLFPIVVMWFYHNSVQWKFKNILPVIVLVVLWFEFTPPKYDVIDSQTTPTEIAQLHSIKGNVVLPIPAGLRDGFTQIGLNNSDMLFYQTLFDKKMIGGYTARLTDDVRQLYLSDSVMKNILILSENPNAVVALPTPQQTEQFFTTFEVDMVCIAPTYKGTKAEEYARYIAAQRGLNIISGEKYLILTKN